jgi:quinol monooxygenase YgiN
MTEWCISYVVAEDVADESSVWVTDVWDSNALMRTQPFEQR